MVCHMNDDTRSEFAREFKMKYLRELTYFLGSIFVKWPYVVSLSLPKCNSQATK